MTARGEVTAVESFAQAVGMRLDGTPLAVMLDVDGTLSPIAPTPDAAAVPEPTRRVIEQLRELPGVTIALVSGRGASDAARIVAIPGVWVIGNHGFEVATPDGAVTSDAAARPHEEAIQKAARALAPLEREVPGALLENKRWTLSLHYRQSDPANVPALLDRTRQVAKELGLRITEGKRVIEVRPPLALDKGTASVALADRLGALEAGGSALYAGDDRTDEDAFRALRRRQPRAVTIRILADPGVPPETEAEVVLKSSEELRDVLAWLVSRRTDRTRGA